MAEAERWMKDTANSCTISAALITTIVFAAAITVPGGNSGENGIPMFARNKAFIIFGVADALSLFISSISILMFLSILTSRYAEQDFLYALPKRLIIGLVALFVSIASMMAAFSATLYLVFGAHKLWIILTSVAGDNWKVVNIVSHRGIYSDASLARDENANKAYQEDTFVNIPNYIPLDDLYVDLGSLPRSPPQFYMDDDNIEDEHEFEDEEDESDGEDEDVEDEDEDVEDEDEEDGENEEDAYMDDEP
ncbi:hypothetical protein QQ045_031988 [Rhodiola kirilowii]